MIKRPLDPRFEAAVMAGRKFTTIREKPWPARVPIMLFRWSGKAYRSPQVNVSPVLVSGWWPIQIERRLDDAMIYTVGMENAKPLHETEGFDSQEEMDAWFRRLVKKGESCIKYLMRFNLLNTEH